MMSTKTDCWRRALGPMAIALGLLALPACYNPSIKDGGFICADAGKPCPDGFSCNPMDGRCHATSCPMIQPICADQPASGKVCNPTCQTGCSCGRCNVSGSTAACTIAVGTKKLGEVCTPSNDNCEPGFICLLESETCGTNFGRCYQHCTTNTQCATVAGRSCEIPILDSSEKDTGFRTCSLAPQQCNPMVTTTNGCGNPALGCYVNAAGTTFCDCPNTKSPVALGGVCNAYNDCGPGLICTTQANLAGTHCRQICTTSGSNTCPSGQHCMTIASGAMYGYCIN